jgi:hypothetical protein
VCLLEDYLLTIRLAIVVARDSLAVEVVQESDDLEVLSDFKVGLGNWSLLRQNTPYSSRRKTW